MPPEQKGAYVDLLSQAWEQTPPCTLPGDDETLARMSGLGSRWKKFGPGILLKFEQLPDGRIRNAKQWRVYQDMLEHKTKRVNASRIAVAARQGNESLNETHNESLNETRGRFVPPSTSTTTSVKEKEGAHAPNGNPETVGAIVARIVPKAAND